MGRQLHIVDDNFEGLGKRSDRINLLLESKVLDAEYPLIGPTSYWCCFIDDLLCLWEGSKGTLTEFI